MVKPNIREEEDLQAVNKSLLETKFPMECKALPFEELEPNEQYIVNKCINHEELTNSEFKELKTLLARYRPLIEKYNPNETIDNFKRSVKVLKTAQEFIDIIDKEKRIQVTVPVFDEIYEMEFILTPSNDTDSIQALATEMDLFKNYNEEERKAFLKARETGTQLTPEETKMANKISRELEEYINENQNEVMTKFLAKQLKFPEDNPSFEKRVEYWGKFPINARVSVFTQVTHLIGLTEDKNFRIIPISN